MGNSDDHRPDPTREGGETTFSAWFAGPKSENSDTFSKTIRRILEDHQYWRRNYFPEDGVVIPSEERRRHGEWNDLFDDKLTELLAALKVDCPFHSPRYAAHMVAEQTLPSIAGYFAAMLYNPNNVSRETAPATVLIELEVGRMIAEMLGYDKKSSWAHLTSGGTIANLEALFVARTVKYLPFVLRDMVRYLDLDHEGVEWEDSEMLGMQPDEALSSLLSVYDAAIVKFGWEDLATKRFIDAYRISDHNVSVVGISSICASIGSEPVLVVPESHHYSLPKHMDLLGLGQRSLIGIKVDERFRMDVDDLRHTLDAIDAAGQHVLSVVAVVGTTEEGAVDPVHEILELRSERLDQGKPSFWLHADAAYGGYLRTTILPERIGLGEDYTHVKINGESIRLELNIPEHHTCDALARLGECDSITVDPHKLGYIPYPAGAVAFKSNIVRPIMRQNAPYIESEPEGPDVERFSESIGLYILEGSKPGAAAASVWLSHATIPLTTEGHGILVRETIRNACELTTLLQEWPVLSDCADMQAEVLCPPESNIVCYAFRPRTEGATIGQLNALNERLYAKNSLPGERRAHVYDQKFFLSRTTLSPAQYRTETVLPFLHRMGVSASDFEDEGIFLLRSALMNPWYSAAKNQGRYYLVSLVEELFHQAHHVWNHLTRSTQEIL